jgi:hypothetical protein
MRIRGMQARHGAASTPCRWACSAVLAATMVVAGACGGESKPPIAGVDEAGVGPFDPYDLLVVAVRHDVPAGTDVPLSLTFERAGTVSTSAYVQPRSANIGEPVRRCAPTASPARR